MAAPSCRVHVENSMNAPSRRLLTDSPWFWLYVFCTAGLIALVLAQPRFAARQVEIERQYQGRDRAFQLQSGQPPATAMSTGHNTIITLTPLYVMLGAAVLVGWGILWWTRFRQRPGNPGPRGSEGPQP